MRNSILLTMLALPFLAVAIHADDNLLFDSWRLLWILQ